MSSATTTHTPSANSTPAPSSVEWPQLGGDTNYLASDLFGGDLFGDELMDMYSSAGQDVVSDHGPEMITSGSMNADKEASFDPSSNNASGNLRSNSSYNDFSTLFPSVTESVIVSSMETSQMDSATAAALQVAGVANSDEDLQDPSVGRKRKVENVPELPLRDDLAPSSDTNAKVVLAPMSAPGGFATVKNTTFAPNVRVATSGGVFHQVKPAEVLSKRRKAASSPKKAPATAANRKAAQAKAVAQFAPLAASQVSKIRENASLLDKTVVAVQSQVGAGVVANPLELVPGGKNLEIPAENPNQSDATGRPSSPEDDLESLEDSGSPALVSPGTISAPSIVSSMQDINATVAAAALAKANALLNNAKNVAALNVQQISQPVKSEGTPSVAPLVTGDIHNETDLSVNLTSSGANTSTAHVNALTSNNWGLGSTGSQAEASLGSKNAQCATAQSQKRRAALTPEDRAKQNRDRNREHARNTRLRKKAYVEELKKTLTEIVAQRDALEIEKVSEKQRDMECRQVRLTVMEEFLKLRGANIQDFRRWSSILDDGFVLTLPQTNYRKMLSSQYRSCNNETDPNPGSVAHGFVDGAQDTAGPPSSRFLQVITGVANVMEDAAMLSEMLVGFENTKNGTTYCGLTYMCQKDRFMMDGTNALVDWTARTNGAKAQGAAHELVLTGNMRASFHAATNKLLSVELSFDTNAVAVQLQTMYPLTFCENSGEHASDADATAALLDSLNVPQLDGYMHDQHHSVSPEEQTRSDVSCKSFSESDIVGKKVQV